MDSFAWMAWTWPTALFFGALAVTLAIMTTLAALKPETDRIGVLRIPTTRGDRLFISLVLAAILHLAWIGFAGLGTIATLPFGEGIDVSSLWIATLISFVVAVIVFRTV